MRWKIQGLAVIGLVAVLVGPVGAQTCTDADNDSYAVEVDDCGQVDCDDTNPAIHPGAGEICNTQDDDCDNQVDEEPAASNSCQTDCTATAQCVAGSCATTPLDCDDQNACTADTCSPTQGGCRHTNQPNGLSCSDGNVCNGDELCQGGDCRPGTPLDCDDQNACTDDSCASSGGCSHTPVPGCCTTNSDCIDVSACTTNERCTGGSCISDQVGCDDSNACTSDSCDPAVGCGHTPVVNGIACGDGDVCNGIETCQGGGCANGAPPACNDGNACTTDGCNALSGCTQQPISGCCSSDADCVDASACTDNERCQNQACVSDTLPCDDGNVCTIDGCSAGSGCTHTPVPNGEACGDLDFCNGPESCQAGTCLSGQSPNCNDGNPCTVDGCNSSVGCTHSGIAGCCFTNGDCADNDLCTVNSRCVGNSCVSDQLNCSDGNLCTIDSCSPPVGCRHVAVIDGTSCADASACDGFETCAGGSCQSGTPLNCDDHNACTNDSCSNSTGCQHSGVASCCNADGECVDGNACTVGERCTAAHACASTALNCSDGQTCTQDICDPSAGCQNPPLASGSCSDANVCTLNDGCVAGSCVGNPKNCSDGDLCNGLESCLLGSGACEQPGAPLQCTPGSRRSTTCTAEWFIDTPNNPLGVMSTKKDCQQGDASCDHDSSPATCTFSVGLCFKISDPRLSRPCVPADVLSYQVLSPKLEKNPVQTVAIVNALLSVPGGYIGGPRSFEISFHPAITQKRCSPATELVVGIGEKLKVRGKALTLEGKDADSLLLRCLP